MSTIEDLEEFREKYGDLVFDFIEPVSFDKTRFEPLMQENNPSN